MKRKPLPIVLALLVAGAAACGRSGDATVVVASGHVEATEVRLATKVAGRIQELALEEGAEVHVGQEIARLDRTDAELILA